MSTLIVVLPPPGAAAGGAASSALPYQFVLSSDGTTVAQHASAALERLPARGRGAREVVALVPAAALSWHRVELPKGTLGRGAAGSPRLRAVLDGLLEDRLLDETSELHFALQPDARAGEPVWVAVCHRNWLRQALQALEQAGRAATRVVPEFEPGAPALHAIGTPQHPQLVATDELGVSLLPLAPASVPLAFHGAPVPQEMTAISEPAVAELAELALDRPILIQTAAERWLQSARSPWDLAQFALANSGRGRAARKFGGVAREWWSAPRWRAARWGLALLLLTQLIGLNAWAWRENAALAAKREAINSTLRTSFPGVQVVVDAPVQMERELALLRQSAGAASGRDFEAILSALGNALAQVAPASPPPSSIEFANGDLRLKGLNLTSQQVAAIGERLRGAGLSARTDADALLVRPVAAAGANT